jgi:hypothetical protein
MKKAISALLLFCLTSNAAMAECDFSTGITPGPNHTFIYTEECHLKVGHLVQDNKTKDAQIADLNQAITLKDLALTKSDDRTRLWMDTSDKLQNRLTTVDELAKKNEWIYFGLGVLATVGAGYVASQIYRH